MKDGKYEQRVTVELYVQGKTQRMRLAQLPNATDELVDVLKKNYPQPKYWVRLITELF